MDKPLLPRTDDKEKPFQCEVCDKCFARKNTLNEHMRTHLGLKPFKCDQCGKTFTKKGSLSVHVKCVHMHENTKSYKCDLCPKVFSTRYYLKVHMAEHDTKNMFKCKTCGKCFVLKSTLIEHMKIHSGEKAFQCDQCGKRFMRKFYLSVHIKSVHKRDAGILQKCKYCGKQFRLKSNLKAHLNTHEKSTYECALCSKVFSSRHYLMIHMSDHDNEKLFKCETCGKCFALKKTLSKHMKIHFGNKSFQCEVCDKCFARKSTLNEHVKTHLGQKPFKCDQCGKTFTKKFSLSVHVKGVHGHGNMKTYKCVLCPKVLSSRYYLKVHKAEHDTRRLFKCETCGRCFVLKCTLKEHMKTHLGEKAFQCEQCGKTFTRKFYLLVHIKSVHQHDLCILHTCHVCDKQFKTKSDLKLHVKVHAKPECLLCFKTTEDCACSWNPEDDSRDRLRKRFARENLMMRCRTCSKPILRTSQLKIHLRIHSDYKCILCNEDYKSCSCCDDYMEVSRTINTYKKTSKSLTSVDKPLTEKSTEPDQVKVKEEIDECAITDEKEFIELSETIIPKDDNSISCNEDNNKCFVNCIEMTKSVNTYQKTSTSLINADEPFREETIVKVKEEENLTLLNESSVKTEKEYIDLSEMIILKDDKCVDCKNGSCSSDHLEVTKSVKTYQKPSKRSTSANDPLTIKRVFKVEKEEKFTVVNEPLVKYEEKSIELSDTFVPKEEPKEIGEDSVELFAYVTTEIDEDSSKAFSIKEESIEL